MKALCVTKYGKNFKKNLSFLDLQLPKLGPQDLQIEIYSAALNPVDYKIARGKVKIVMNPPKPFPLGFDMAGRIIKKGLLVDELEVGDMVYSKVPWNQMGTIATHINVASEHVSLMPKNLSYSEAASLPLVGCTVIEAFQTGKLKAGMKILILGGSGGIGSFAIQYAKCLGAEVYTTTSTKNVAWVKSLGADVVIDYKKSDYRKLAIGVNFVLDTLGGNNTISAINLIKKGGTIISIAGHYDTETLKSIGIPKIYIILNQLSMTALMWRMRLKKIDYKHVWSQPNRQRLDEITALVEQGKIKPIIDREYQFDEAIDALYYLQTNRAKGKVIIQVKATDN